MIVTLPVECVWGPGLKGQCVRVIEIEAAGRDPKQY